MEDLPSKYSERALERRRVGGTYQTTIRPLQLDCSYGLRNNVLELLVNNTADAETADIVEGSANDENIKIARSPSPAIDQTPLKEKGTKFSKHPDFSLPTPLRDATPAYKRLDRENQERERAYLQYKMEMELEKQRQQQLELERRLLREKEQERKRQQQAALAKQRQQMLEEQEQKIKLEMEAEKLRKEEELQKAKRLEKKLAPTRWPAPFSTFIPLYTPPKTGSAKPTDNAAHKKSVQDDLKGDLGLKTSAVPKKPWSKMLEDIESMTLEDIELPVIEPRVFDKPVFMQPADVHVKDAWDSNIIVPASPSGSDGHSSYFQPAHVEPVVPLPSSPMFPPSSPQFVNKDPADNFMLDAPSYAEEAATNALQLPEPPAVVLAASQATFPKLAGEHASDNMPVPDILAVADTFQEAPTESHQLSEHIEDNYMPVDDDFGTPYERYSPPVENSSFADFTDYKVPAPKVPLKSKKKPLLLKRPAKADNFSDVSLSSSESESSDGGTSDSSYAAPSPAPGHFHGKSAFRAYSNESSDDSDDDLVHDRRSKPSAKQKSSRPKKTKEVAKRKKKTKKIPKKSSLSKKSSKTHRYRDSKESSSEPESSSSESAASDASIELPKTRAGFKSWGIEPDILREYGGRTIVTIRKSKH